jgi:transposase
MTRPLSEDLRERVIAYIETGKNCANAARKFEISYSSAHRWYSKYIKTGSCKARPYPGKKPMLSNEEFSLYVKSHPNSTLAQIGSHFGMSAKSAHYYMKKCKFSYKKKSPATWKQMSIQEEDILKK